MQFDVKNVRTQFSALRQFHKEKPVTFMDGPGGSQVPIKVLDAMTQYLGHFNSNLGGKFFSSQLTTELVQNARNASAEFLNAESGDNIVFGPNMTSLTFQLSRAISRDWRPGDEVIVTALDHYSNVSSWQLAAEDKGAIVKQVRVHEQECTLDMEHLSELVSERTQLIAVTYASNTTGSIVDVKAVIKLAKRVGAQVYIDAVHYAPHHLIDVQELGCDFLVCSAYKFFGPHLGIAYVSPQWLNELIPYKVEPATNIGPGRYETGTQSFEAMAGLIETLNYLSQWGSERNSLRKRLQESYSQFEKHEHRLSSYFIDKLNELPNVRLYGVPFGKGQRTPTFAIRLEGYSPEEVAKELAEQNFCVWNGHFYALGLIRQLGLESIGGVLRIGFMHYNTIEEIDQLFLHLRRFTN